MAGAPRLTSRGCGHPRGHSGETPRHPDPAHRSGPLRGVRAASPPQALLAQLNSSQALSSQRTCPHSPVRPNHGSACATSAPVSAHSPGQGAVARGDRTRTAVPPVPVHPIQDLTVVDRPDRSSATMSPCPACELAPCRQARIPSVPLNCVCVDSDRRCTLASDVSDRHLQVCRCQRHCRTGP